MPAAAAPTHAPDNRSMRRSCRLPTVSCVCEFSLGRRSFRFPFSLLLFLLRHFEFQFLSCSVCCDDLRVFASSGECAANYCHSNNNINQRPIVQQSACHTAAQPCCQPHQRCNSSWAHGFHSIPFLGAKHPIFLVLAAVRAAMAAAAATTTIAVIR